LLSSVALFQMLLHARLMWRLWRRRLRGYGARRKRASRVRSRSIQAPTWPTSRSQRQPPRALAAVAAAAAMDEMEAGSGTSVASAARWWARERPLAAAEAACLLVVAVPIGMDSHVGPCTPPAVGVAACVPWPLTTGGVMTMTTARTAAGKAGVGATMMMTTAYPTTRPHCQCSHSHPQHRPRHRFPPHHHGD